MKSNYYQIYLQSCIDLVATLIIKSSSTADLMNTYLNLQIGNAGQLVSDYYNPDDKTTWKYYLNLSGQYLLPFDQTMFVKSLDTLEDIEFTPDNLKQNPLTFQAYQYGSIYYNKLIAEYPNQVPLINSILYPTDIATAIAAKDGQILAYDTSLVESNEYSLIEELQNYIYTYKQRWSNSAFEITDSLYIVANLGIMYLNLVPEVLNIRLKYAKTPQVNSFHVDQYLASHNALNEYTNQFSLDEKLYLYRNINYIQRNAGLTSTFNSLIQKFVIPNQINLVTYKLVHEGFDTNNNEKIRFKQESLTGTNTAAVYYNISDILNYESTLLDNSAFITNYSTELTNQISNSRYTDLPTKIVKTVSQNNIPLVQHTKQDLVINTWGWLANNGYYTANINFVNPINQVEYTLSAIDAFLYMVYIEATALGISLEYIPAYFIQRAPITYYQSLTNLEEYLTTNNIPTSTPNELQTLINSQIQLNTMSTPNEFINYCNELYTLVEAQDIYINSIGDIDRKAQYKLAVNLFYTDEIIDFPSTYGLVSDWLLKNSLPEYSYTLDEAQLLLNSIVLASTGHNYNINQGINFNRNIVELMSTLSSYNIQYIITENRTVVYIIENGVSINSQTLSVQYSDNTGTVYSSPSYSAGYSSYEEYGYVGNTLYMNLASSEKNMLTDIYSL